MILDYPRTSTMYAVTGTRTFRLGSKMILGSVGENIQNKDKDIRFIYMSDGYDLADIDLVKRLEHYLKTSDITLFSEEELQRIKILIQVDQSGAEALIVSYLCNAGKFRDLFLHGVKPHVFVALHVFAEEWQRRLPDLNISAFVKAQPKDLTSLPDWKRLDKLIKSSDEWIASERFYYIAKMICHAANYGMRGPTFALNVLQKSEGSIRLSERQSTIYLEGYHSLFPEIRQMHNTIQNELTKNNRFLRNLFGEPREFNGFWGDSLFKEAYAFIPQSTVGEITNRAKRFIYEHIQAGDIEGLDQLANGHDSILAQCRIGDEFFCAGILKHYLNADLVSPRGEKFNMKSEAQRGFNWSPSKVKKDGSIYNPMGLQEIKI